MKFREYLLSLLIVAFSYGSDYAKSLKLTIDLDKRIYQKYESIYGIAKLVNISQTTQKVSPHFDLSSHVLKLTCTEKNGEIYSGHSNSATIIQPTASYELLLNDSLLHPFNLLYSFGERDESELHLFYLPEGEYILFAEFKPGYDYRNKPGDFEIIYSNKFSFKVINSKLIKKESQFYQRLTQAVYNRNINRIKEENREKRNKITEQLLNELRDIVSTNPNSIYIDIAFFYLLFYEPMKGDTFFRAIDRYHNSYFFSYKLPGMIAGENQKYEGVYLKYLNPIQMGFIPRPLGRNKDSNPFGYPVACGGVVH